MTPTTMPGYMPFAIAAAVAFAIYRRIRSNFGRQPWRPRRTVARTVLLGLLLAFLVFGAVMTPGALLPVAGALVAGAGLALLALRLVQVDVRDGQASYVPNPWIGAGLTALLLGRLAWRFTHGGFASPGAASSPLTMGIGALVLSFYVVQGLGLLRRMKRVAPPAVVA